MDNIVEDEEDYGILEDCISGTSLKFLEENCSNVNIMVESEEVKT